MLHNNTLGRENQLKTEISKKRLKTDMTERKLDLWELNLLSLSGQNAQIT